MTWPAGEPCGTEGLHGTFVSAEDAQPGVRAGAPGRWANADMDNADMIPEPWV